MTAAQVLSLVIGAAAVAFSIWVYRRREVPVKGRSLLAAVRASTIGLLALLLLDPTIPAPARASGGAAAWVALDGSLSMAVAGEGEDPPWERAVERARDLQRRGSTLVAFGDELRFSAEDPTLLDSPPRAGSSRLGPILERALEAGAGEVVVLSDLRIADPVAVRALLERSAMTVRFEQIGASPVDAGVARFDLPQALSPDGPSTAQLAVHASETASGRLATVEVREEDRLVFSQDVVLPGPGLLTEIPVTLPPPLAQGSVRYEARVRLAQDVFADDDARVAYGSVDPEEGLLVAVSLVPDWELRFLLPVLEQVTGLSARSYVRVGGGRYFATGGSGAPGLVDEAEVQRRVKAAEMVVIQGLSDSDPEWLRAGAAAARRAVLIPANPGGARAVGIDVRDARGGEWYVVPEMPASALTSDLAGVSWQGLPPLTQLLPVAGAEVATSALRVQLRDGGGSESALLLQEDEGGRHALLLASGFWRWAFRSGTPREAYRRLWAGVAGWLLEDSGLAGGAGLRPESRVVARDAPLRWLAPGLAGQQIALNVTRAGAAALDTVLTPGSDGVVESPAMPAGTYQYRATWTAAEGGSAEGRLDVEAYTGELRYPPASSLLDSVTAVAGADGEGRITSRRPMRTHPAPYLLLLALLSGEWIARRRRGLR